MQLRWLPVFTLALGSVLTVSCAKQADAPPPAPAATAAADKAPAQTAGQTTNFEDQTQTQAPVASPAPSN